MKHFKLNVLLMAVMSSVFVACTREVTNYGTPPTNSTLATQTSTASGEGGGVINGGGGRGVLCLREGKETVEVLDLYEAHTLYDLKIVDFGDEESVLKKVSERLAHHMWQPGMHPVSVLEKNYRKTMLEDFRAQIRFIDAGKKLKLVDDAYAPTLEDGCTPIQIAMYYDESVLLIDKNLWDKMNWTNKAALLVHESLYFWVRQMGTKNSMSVRKLVGLLFSEKGPRPMFDGVPENREESIECTVSSNGFRRGGFYLFSSKDEKNRAGVEAVFNGAGEGQSFFRTSAFFEDFSLSRLRSAKIDLVISGEIRRDTYPSQAAVQLKLTGHDSRSMWGAMSVSRSMGQASETNFDVRCQLPQDFSKLEKITTEPGRYESKRPSGVDLDQLEVSSNGQVTYVTTRQVGAKDSPRVPYPTSCRYKSLAMVTDQDDKNILISVYAVELVENDENSKSCHNFVADENERLARSAGHYTLYKAEFNKFP